MSEPSLSDTALFPRLRALDVPDGRSLELPGRGATFVREAPGPPGSPALMLLHGLSATAGLNWAPAIGPLSRRYRVVAIDHRGHGRGIRSDHFRLTDCADDIVAAADQLGIDQFVPVGYSMGGPIAQLVWRRHPDRVAGLVLCATARDFQGRVSDQVRFLGVAALGATLHAVPRSLGMPGWAVVSHLFTAELADPTLRDWAATELRRHDSRLILEAAADLGRFTSRDWIGSVDVPTAVIVTLRDQLVPAHRQLKLAEAISGATVQTVDADHFAITRDPAAFLRALHRACYQVVSGPCPDRSRSA